MRRAARALLVAAGALSSIVIPYRVAHTPLAPLAERVLGRALGLAPREVSVGAARLVAPATLRLERVRLGRLSAQRIELGADLWAALRGQAQLGSADAQALAVEALGTVASVEARLRDGQARGVARGVRAQLSGVPLAAAEVGIELQEGRLRRAAFARASVVGIDGIAGSATREPDGSWSLRAGRPGLSLSGRLDGETLAVEATLERLPLAALAPLGARAGVDLSRAVASGRLHGDRSDGAARVRGTLALAELAIVSPALSAARLEHLAPRFELDLRLADGALVAAPLRMVVGPVDLTAEGQGRLDGRRVAGTVRLARVGCAELLRGLPRPLLPVLDGLTLDGALEGRVTFAVDRDAAAPQVQLEPDLDVRCRVLADAPLADPSALGSPITARTRDGRWLMLGPTSPSFRALPALPPHLVRAFVVAEDGRFFAHHGFDADRIRRALAADLSAGRFERGASTITQQLAKNLFLSGERTLARKLEEAVLAWRLEQVVPKRRLLELYLNLVELAPGANGVAEGAERYFGKQPEELTPDEAAQLAALLPAPRRGMDDAWEKRYRALAARLVSEKRAATAPRIATRR